MCELHSPYGIQLDVKPGECWHTIPSWDCNKDVSSTPGKRTAQDLATCSSCGPKAAACLPRWQQEYRAVGCLGAGVYVSCPEQCWQPHRHSAMLATNLAFLQQLVGLFDTFSSAWILIWSQEQVSRTDSVTSSLWKYLNRLREDFCPVSRVQHSGRAMHKCEVRQRTDHKINSHVTNKIHNSINSVSLHLSSKAVCNSSTSPSSETPGICVDSQVLFWGLRKILWDKTSMSTLSRAPGKPYQVGSVSGTQQRPVPASSLIQRYHYPSLSECSLIHQELGERLCCRSWQILTCWARPLLLVIRSKIIKISWIALQLRC